MSCGDFDGNQLKRESAAKNLTVPNYMRRWINLKKVFPMHLIDESVPAKDFTSPITLKKAKPVIHGMEDMLQKVGLQLEGRHHSGIDDSRNIARVVL